MANHSSDQLDAMREHIAYERWMLHETARRLSPSNPSVIENALLESFMVHARILLEVLYRHSAKDADQVGAWDYLPNWTKTRCISKESKRFFEGELAKINTRVAHLSVDRLNVTPADAGQDIVRIAAEIEVLYQNFKAQYEQHKQSETESEKVISATYGA